MEDFDLKENFKLGLFVSLIFLFLLFLISTFKPRNFAVFCDVGQGDAAYLRLNSTDILIDAGPSNKVLNCLGENMPFWDKKIEVAILSHPQKDHYGGFLYVLPRYKVNYFLMPEVEGEASSFKKFEELLEKEKAEIIFPTAGKVFKINGTTLTFFWPTKDFINSQLAKDLNDYSLIFKLNFRDFSILFTGDASKWVQGRLSQWAKSKSPLSLKVKILKVPHHGSAKNLSKEFIKLADPRLAVISVGKNNSYGHPSQEVLDFLKALNIKVWRTDEMGELKIDLVEKL